jgi:hypothetical protein
MTRSEKKMSQTGTGRPGLSQGSQATVLELRACPDLLRPPRSQPDTSWTQMERPNQMTRKMMRVEFRVHWPVEFRVFWRVEFRVLWRVEFRVSWRVKFRVLGMRSMVYFGKSEGYAVFPPTSTARETAYWKAGG